METHAGLSIAQSVVDCFSLEVAAVVENIDVFVILISVSVDVREISFLKAPSSKV